MNRILYMIVTLCCSLTLWSQSLTEAELDAKMNKADQWFKTEQYQKALDLFRFIGEQTEGQQTDHVRQLHVESRLRVCQCLQELNQYQEAYQLAKGMFEEKLSEEEQAAFAQVYALNGLLLAYQKCKRDERGYADYAKARAYLTEIKPFANDSLKSYIQNLEPYTWYFEGGVKKTFQQFNEALICLEHAQRIYAEQRNTDYEIDAIREIASILHFNCDFARAMHRYQIALDKARAIHHPIKEMQLYQDFWEVSKSLEDIELQHLYMANMDSLISTNNDANLQMMYATQKGLEAHSSGQDQIAEQWYLKARAIAETLDSQKRTGHLQTIDVKLRELYTSLKRYEEALQFGKLALQEFHIQFPASNSNYYFPFISIADIYRFQNNKDSCLAYVDSLFLSEPLIHEPKSLKNLYVTRARCLASFNEFTSALADCRKADEILASKYPATDDDRVRLQALIGGIEHRLGHYQESETHYQKYMEGIKSIYGDQSLEYLQAKIYLAHAAGFANHIDLGCATYTHAIEQLKGLVKNRLRLITTTERTGFWNKVSPLFTQMTPYALKAELYQTAFTKSCYDALVLSKAFLLESERTLYDIVKREGTDEQMKMYLQLLNINGKLQAWEKNYTQFADSILQFSQQAKVLEDQLRKGLSSYSRIASCLDVDYEQVKNALKSKEVLIDFTDYVSESAGHKYAAYIIHREQNFPLLKPLFVESEIDSLGIMNPHEYYEKVHAAEMVQRIWDPLKEQVEEGATVYYVPSQLLFQISLESLPLPDGSLLGQHYQFVRLSSARELIKREGRTQTFHPTSAVLYGDLTYDLNPADMEREARKYNLVDLLMLRGDPPRGNSIFQPLPGTQKEIVQITSILQKEACEVKPLRGMEGTEESFLNLHGQAPKIIHIATHGFYFTPNQAEQIDYLKGYTDAMNLSGLVLAGGNAAWTGKELPQGVLSGILSANNIARLDLSNTEMVVLSACQSGLGKATSEGLYGLQRAFKKAGVGTIVMSLWSISDRVATEFMVTFYRQLTQGKHPWDKHRAFEETKSIIRDKYPEPFYWAAFVMLD